MSFIDVKFEENQDKPNNYFIFLNGEKVGHKTNVYEKRTVYFENDDAYDKLKHYEIRQLLEHFYSFDLDINLSDGMEVNIRLCSRPYAPYKSSTFSHFEVKSCVRFDLERWKKSWSIMDYFETHFSLLESYRDIETSCDVYDNDSSGNPIYDTLNGVGIKYSLLDVDLSQTLSEVVDKITKLTSEIHFQTKNMLGKENSIERCLEFPPEYYHAGLGILQFFNTYLRENYPVSNATVKIEQCGNKVRMIVESEDGQLDTIERALHEYELIVTGAVPSQHYVNSDKLLLELKSELRIAQARIENQKDIIGIQSSRIDRLLDIMAGALSVKSELSLDIAPSITVNNSMTLNHHVCDSISTVSELQEISNNSQIDELLDLLKSSLLDIESENNPSAVRHSAAMSRFKKLVEDMKDNSSSINQSLKAIDSGLIIAARLARKYNAIAKWCGLPIIPFSS